MIFLPPANEVWGKVIFSQACVKNSVHGGDACSWGGVWSQGGTCSGGSGPGGCLLQGGAWWTPRTATAVGSTHTTGMHSCYICVSFCSQGGRVLYPGRICIKGGSASKGGGLHLGGGFCFCTRWRRVGRPPSDTTRYDKRAGDAHPTGMHPCYLLLCCRFITEKLHKCLNSRVLPIVLGASLAEVATVAPEDSFLHVDNFTSPKQLAEYLNYLDKNDDAYNKYVHGPIYATLRGLFTLSKSGSKGGKDQRTSKKDQNKRQTFSLSRSLSLGLNTA